MGTSRSAEWKDWQRRRSGVWSHPRRRLGTPSDDRQCQRFADGTLIHNRAHLSTNSGHDRCAGGAGGCDRPAICLDRHRPRDQLDPYPFVFLLTCSNVIQLILIFVIAVAQRQLSLHDELRAEADHGAISRLLYHQEAQELLLVRLAEKLDVDARDLRPILSTLAGKAARPPA